VARSVAARSAARSAAIRPTEARSGQVREAANRSKANRSKAASGQRAHGGGILDNASNAIGRIPASMVPGGTGMKWVAQKQLGRVSGLLNSFSPKA
jgi:hypothetical protein